MRNTLNKNFQDVLGQFETVMATKDIENMKSTFISPTIDFLVWLESKGICEIKRLDNNPEITIEYLEYIYLRPNKRTGNPLSASMKTKLRYALTVLLEELVNLGILKKAFVTSKRTKNEYVGRNPFTPEEIKQLYTACETKLERMIMNLGYSFGMRRTEIQRLNHGDVNYSKGFVIIKKGKFSKRREVFNPDNILNEMRDYLISDRQNLLVKKNNFMEESFLVNSRGKRLKGAYANSLFKAVLERSEVNREGSLHDLRASIISHLLEAGMPMEKVQEFAGHSVIDTVHVYAMQRKMSKNFKNVA